ncbi:MAG TPA: FAD-dependent oxidoreductase [Hydrogenophaga sp.]|nr:FAD-dependent oxidoreductase [Hydrogenophaga sp.]
MSVDLDVEVEVAIVGAGVIGLAIALQLLDDGHEVLLIDPNGPGSGASFGNAATIADYGCVPVGGPHVLRSLPRLLLDSESPLSLPPSAVPAMLPWLLRFLRASMPKATAAGAAALAPLLARAGPAWERRWAALQCEELVRREGCLYLYREAPSRKDFDFRLRARHGVQQEMLSPAEVARLEPALAPLERHGIFFPQAMHIDSPVLLMQRMAAATQRQGGQHQRARVVQMNAEGPGVRLELQAADSTPLSVRARQVVISAGAHSLALARQAGEAVPLDTERGYHVEYALNAAPVRRPVCPVERGIYATPMKGRLRVAGTVEFGGLSRPANPKRLELLDRGARELFPLLPRPSSQWLGFRPSMPDSLPVIGRARGIPSVLLAFGHGHLGLTLAAVTAELVAAEVGGSADANTLTPYSPRRWSR